MPRKVIVLLAGLAMAALLVAKVETVTLEVTGLH